MMIYRIDSLDADDADSLSLLTDYLPSKFINPRYLRLKK